MPQIRSQTSRHPADYLANILRWAAYFPLVLMVPFHITDLIYAAAWGMVLHWFLMSCGIVVLVERVAHNLRAPH